MALPTMLRALATRTVVGRYGAVVAAGGIVGLSVLMVTCAAPGAGASISLGVLHRAARGLSGPDTLRATE